MIKMSMDLSQVIFRLTLSVLTTLTKLTNENYLVLEMAQDNSILLSVAINLICNPFRLCYL